MRSLAHADAGHVRRAAGVERLRAFEVAEEADAGRAWTELGIERAFDRVAERLRVERRVRGRREAKPASAP